MSTPYGRLYGRADPKHLAVPWKGLNYALPPHLIADGEVSYVQNFLFNNGHATLAPSFTAYNPLPMITLTDGTQQRLRNVKKIFLTNTRGGDRVMLFVCRNGVYIGGLSRVYPIIRDDAGWEVVPGLPPQFAHYATDACDWFILHDGKKDGLFKFWYGVDEFAVEIGNRYDLTRLMLMHAKYMTVFGDRVVFGNLYMQDGPMGHGFAWFGIGGPFDNTFPSAGYEPLTEDAGDITGLQHCRNFLVIFKKESTYVVQKQAQANFPFRVVRADPSVGCPYIHTAQQIPRSKITLFADQFNNMRAFDGETSEIISSPVSPILRDADLSTAFTALDPVNELYVIALNDQLLVWNYVENWWTVMDAPRHLQALLPYIVDTDVVLINEVDTLIDDTPGIIDLGGKSVSHDVLTAVTEYGFSVLSDKTLREGKLRTKEYTFSKATTVSRLKLSVKSLYGGTIRCRHSTDGGNTWSAWQGIAKDNIFSMSEVFYNFVATTTRIMFEVFVSAFTCTFADLVLDIAPDREQSPHRPRTRDFNVEV